MHRSKIFVKKTRGGKVMNVVREHYLRDDIPCGIIGCTVCPEHSPQQNRLDIRRPSSPLPLSSLLIVDTNVVLHQLDLLQSRCGLFDQLNLVFLQTVIDEVQHQDARIHTRLLSLLQSHPHAFAFSNEHHRATYVDRLPSESPNDRNDRAIRTASLWYSRHNIAASSASSPPLTPHVLMLTEDSANREKALADSLPAVSIRHFVQQHAAAFPQLVEMLAALRSEEKEKEKEKAAASWTYPEHLSAEEVRKGLDSGQLKRGTFKVSREYNSDATVSVRASAASTSSSVLIPDLRSMNRAVDGDVVVVELLPQAQWRRPSTRLQPTMDEQSMVDVAAAAKDSDDQTVDPLPVSSSPSPSPSSSFPVLPTGRVVAIAQRNWRSYCGSLELSDRARGSFLFLSVNRRIPAIRISTSQAAALMPKRISVAIDSWPADSRHPLGHYVATIGDIGDRDAETAVLLLEHDVSTAAWTNAVLACLPQDRDRILPQDCAGRIDYRDVAVFSIDPPGCTDIDDALHVRLLPNGHYEVGVHIADVAHYVRPDTALDLEAASRATSVYLVDRRIDMLPAQLSTSLCSLQAGKDRLTFSVVWEMQEDGRILSTAFHRAVIRSVAAFTYAQAQQRIDAPDTDTDPITIACKRLNAVAKRLKQRRLDAGALTLASQEVKFLLDSESQRPTDLAMYETRESNSLVEEMMLLANISVASRIADWYPSASLLRRHPAPPADNFLPLIRAAAVVGIPIRAETSRQLAASLDAAVIPGFPFFNKLLRILTTRCLTQALYFCSGDLQRSEYLHYGLAAPIYTHFTSPIRRYADIVVHRLLAASVGYHPLPASLENSARMQEVVDNLNHRHRMAQLVSRASTELFTLIYFAEAATADAAAGGQDGQQEGRDGEPRVVGRVVEEDAMIVSVRSNGVRVMIPRYGIEGSIALHSERRRRGEQEAEEGRAEPSPYTLDEEKQTVSGPRGVFRIFEQVRVRVCVKERKRRRWLSIQLLETEGAMQSRPVQEVDDWKGKLASAAGVDTVNMEEKDERKEGAGDTVLVVEEEEEAGGGSEAVSASSVKRRRVFQASAR